MTIHLRRRRAEPLKKGLPWKRLLLSAAALTVAGCVLFAYRAALRWDALEVQAVGVRGKLVQLSRSDLEEAAAAAAAGNFFTVDVNAVRHAVEALPWVRTVTVRKIWPNRIDIELEEQVAFARWNDDALLNPDGQVFFADFDGDLPAFVGPDGTEADVLRHYRRFRDALTPLKRTPKEVRLSERGAWRLVLDDGLTVELGRSEPLERLARFVTLYRNVAMPAVDGYVDLRYPNGFALRVKETVQDAAPNRKGKRP